MIDSLLICSVAIEKKLLGRIKMRESTDFRFFFVKARLLYLQNSLTRRES